METAKPVQAKVIFLAVIALITLSTVSAVVISIGSLRGCDTFNSYYPTYKDAVKDGAVKRGWIPGFIPASVTDIYEQHNLDTNKTWIRFSVPQNDAEELFGKMKPLTYEEIEALELRRPSDVDWWFNDIIDKHPANDSAMSAYLYIYTNQEMKGRYYLARNRESDAVYCWYDPY